MYWCCLRMRGRRRGRWRAWYAIVDCGSSVFVALVHGPALPPGLVAAFAVVIATLVAAAIAIPPTARIAGPVAASPTLANAVAIVMIAFPIAAVCDAACDAVLMVAIAVR